MRSSERKSWGAAARTALLAALLCALAVAPSFSRARDGASVTVTNNSSRIIGHLYTSPTDRDDWSADQLPDDSNLGYGATFTLTNVACSGDRVKVIAEDKEGCFLYAVVSCQGSSAWTITNDTQRDCGN